MCPATKPSQPINENTDVSHTSILEFGMETRLINRRQQAQESVLLESLSVLIPKGRFLFTIYRIKLKNRMENTYR